MNKKDNKKNIEKLMDLFDEMTRMTVQNFYYEVNLGRATQTGTELVNNVRKAREVHDKKAMLKNNIELLLKKIIENTGRKTTDKCGQIFESVSFLLDVFVINHLKVWFAEEEIRNLCKLEYPDAEYMNSLVNMSRQANNNRINIRELLEKKLEGILSGKEDLGNTDPKHFRAWLRK